MISNIDNTYLDNMGLPGDGRDSESLFYLQQPVFGSGRFGSFNGYPSGKQILM